MRLFNIRGKLVPKNVTHQLIKWDEPSRSKMQFNVKQFFKPYWKTHICYEEFPVYGTLLKVDLLNATKRIAVEVNGKQHEEYNEFFFKTNNEYGRALKRDMDKIKWLELNNFKYIQIEVRDMKKLSPEYIQETFDINIY